MKQNRGAISLYTLLSMLFFLIFIMTAYSNVSSSGKLQVETTQVLTDEYVSDTNAETIYQSLDGGDFPVAEKDILAKSSFEKDTVNDTNNNGKYIFANGKFYLLK